MFGAGCLGSEATVFCVQSRKQRNHNPLQVQPAELPCLSPPHSCWDTRVGAFPFSRLCEEVYELWEEEPGFLQFCLLANRLWCGLWCNLCLMSYQTGLLVAALSCWRRCLFYLTFLKYCLWDLCSCLLFQRAVEIGHARKGRAEMWEDTETCFCIRWLQTFPY